MCAQIAFCEYLPDIKFIFDDEKIQDQSQGSISGNVIFLSPAPLVKQHQTKKSSSKKLMSVGVNYGWYSMPVVDQRSTDKFKHVNHYVSSPKYRRSINQNETLFASIAENRSDTERFQ